MRRTRVFDLTVYILASALILISAGADADAQKKSRGGRKASSTSAKKSTSKKGKQSKSDAKRSARGKSGRGSAGRSRVAKSGRTRLSRRERRALASKDRGRGGSKRELARKGRSSRPQYEAPVRAAQERDDEGQELSAPQPRIVAGGIQPDRVTEIQNALTKAGVFEGPASGQYDESTASAMKRFQVKNGLPATGLPSAHTLKRLGVSKRSNDGYAVPVNTDKKRQE